MTNQLIVGLTGGIGAGKSIVSKIFKTLGVSVFNSDDEAKLIVNQDKEVVESIQEIFGDVYIDGELNTKLLSEKVFKDKKALKTLNEIIHPKVKERFHRWIKEHENEKILIKEAAILIETNGYQELDKTILVIAPVSIRKKRVMRRDGMTSAAFENRIKSQLSDTEKIKAADFIIHNDDEQLIIPQVLSIYQKLKSLL